MPQAFATHPREQFERHVYVAPFYEDDVEALRTQMPIERMLFGSDFPHPEGAAEPLDYLDEFRSFAPEITPSKTTSADDCRLALVFRAPAGASYQVSRFVFRGYAYLEKGVEADLTTSHYFQLDQSQSEQLTTTMLSPFDGDYAIEARTRFFDHA